VHPKDENSVASSELASKKRPWLALVGHFSSLLLCMIGLRKEPSPCKASISDSEAFSVCTVVNEWL